MFKIVELESTRFWEEVAALRQRQAMQEQLLIARGRRRRLGLGMLVATAVAIALVCGMFDQVDVLGPARQLGKMLHIGPV